MTARPPDARALRRGIPRPDRSGVESDGMLLVDKPDGPTSRAMVDLVVGRFGRRDIGHAGTLDPFATGLLLVLVGRATRLVPWIQEWPKRYRAVIRFGAGTDTLDRTGTITSRGNVPDDLADRLPAALARRIRVRFMPEIYFRPDDSATRGVEMDKLLRDLREGKLPPDEDQES